MNVSDTELFNDWYNKRYILIFSEIYSATVSIFGSVMSLLYLFTDGMGMLGRILFAWMQGLVNFY